MNTPHSADALKPCPFCGGKATYHAGVDCGINVAFAGCDDCKIGSPVVSSLSEAIAAWNRRPTPASPGLDNEAAARLRKQAEEAKKVRGVVALSPEDAFALLDCLEREDTAASPDLVELRRLAEAATKGPWRTGTYPEPLELAGPAQVCIDIGHESKSVYVLASCNENFPKDAKANAAYIAAANPAAILALLDRLERAEAAARAVPDLEFLIDTYADAWGKAFSANNPFDTLEPFNEELRGYIRAGLTAVLAAAPPAQGLPAAPDDPMDWRLPCDVKVGSGTHKKGTTLRSLVSRMEMLHGMAMKAHPVDEAKAAEFRAFLDQQFGSSPPAAAPSEPVAWMVVMPSGEIEEGHGYFDKDEAEDYVHNRAIPGCSLAPLVIATHPAQDAGTGDATIVAIGYESGFMATDPDHDGATVKLHYRDEATAEAAFCAITRIIDRAIANSGRTE